MRLRAGGLSDTVIIRTSREARKAIDRISYLESALPKMDPDTQQLNIAAINTQIEALKSGLEGHNTL